MPAEFAGTNWGDESKAEKGMKRIYVIPKAGIYTSIIRDKIPLSSLNFDLIAKQPGLLAFSREQRAIKLGGVPI